MKTVTTFAFFGFLLLAGGTLYSEISGSAYDKWAEFHRGRCAVLGDLYRATYGKAECRFSTNLVFLETYGAEAGR